MAHLEHRKLNDPSSNNIMEQLGFVNLADCNEGFSTWNIYPAGKISLPLNAKIITWKDLLPYLIK